MSDRPTIHRRSVVGQLAEAVRLDGRARMHTVRIGVLGTGTIIRDFHLPALKGDPRAVVVAAGNLHPESLKHLAVDFDILRTYTDFAQMAADPGMDAVVNALPNYLHAPVTIQMLEAGKHVLCEKPMAMSVAEGKQMIEAARRAKRKLMIAHNRRHNQEILWLRELVAAGRLGHIYKAKTQAIWHHGGPARESWRVKRELAGGGVLADMGVHAIDALRFVLGNARPTGVLARVESLFEDIEVDDTATMLLEFEGGVAALMESGWYHHYGDRLGGYIHLYGTKGYARAAPSELHTHIEGVWSVVQPQMPEPSDSNYLQMFFAQMSHFLECVLHDREPISSGSDGLWTLRVLEAAYRSAETGQSVSIDD